LSVVAVAGYCTHRLSVTDPEPSVSFAKLDGALPFGIGPHIARQRGDRYFKRGVEIRMSHKMFYARLGFPAAAKRPANLSEVLFYRAKGQRPVSAGNGETRPLFEETLTAIKGGPKNYPDGSRIFVRWISLRLAGLPCRIQT
jgi:hypothetical protein